MIVSIIAGGHSFADVDPAKVPGKVIVVNGAATHLVGRKFDHVVTMDRLWAEDFWPWAKAAHTSASPAEWLFHVRNHAIKNVPAWARAYNWVRIFECDNRGNNPMSRDTGWLNGNHSGRGAMNLAYQICPEKLYLFGFDMCLDKMGRSYWYQPYKWVRPSGGTGVTRLRQWAEEMAHVAPQFAAAGIEVINVSRHSIIQCFRKVSPRELGVSR
jgi:hypothetical protein